MLRDDIHSRDKLPSELKTLNSLRTTAPALAEIVVRLRVRGTEEVFDIPPRADKLHIGTRRQYEICLADPSRQISRLHACLHREGTQWIIEDQRSTNGLFINGELQAKALLSAGMEIGLGGAVTLIAESGRWIRLRELLLRLLGRGTPAAAVLERTLHELREIWTLREAKSSILFLEGDGDLTFLAQVLHKRLFTNGPFVMCDPGRKAGEGDARSALNVTDFAKALQLAEHGTVCLRNQRWPKHFPGTLETLHQQGRSHPLLILCGPARELPSLRTIPRIVIPSLADWERSGVPEQIDHIVAGFFADAARELGSKQVPTEEEHRWVRRHCTTLADVEKSTRRILALKMGSLGRAAERLGMARVSLERWITRRGLPQAKTKANPRRSSSS